MRLKLLKTYFCSVLFSLSLVTVNVVQAGEEIEKSIQVPATGHLFIDNDRGSVDVKGWDKTEILVRGEVDDDSQELLFKNKGEKTLIQIKIKKAAHRGDVHSSEGNELEIYVPKHIQVHFKGIDTEFSLAGLDAGVQGKTINGEVLIENVHTKINVTSISGDVKVSESSGKAYVESMRGDVNIVGEFEDVHLQSVAGDIWADISKIEKLKAKNVSGNTTAVGQLISDANVNFASVEGDIHYKAAGILNAECEIISQFGGDIVNKLTDDQPEQSLMQRKHLKFLSGDGSATLLMKTINGTVIIDR